MFVGQNDYYHGKKKEKIAFTVLLHHLVLFLFFSLALLRYLDTRTFRSHVFLRSPLRKPLKNCFRNVSDNCFVVNQCQLNTRIRFFIVRAQAVAPEDFTTN